MPDQAPVQQPADELQEAVERLRQRLVLAEGQVVAVEERVGIVEAKLDDVVEMIRRLAPAE